MALKIGISSCFFHADPQRAVFKGKTLLYLEQSLSQWIMSGGALCYLIPPPAGPVSLSEQVAEMDALVLQGGSDLAPKSYGETPLKPEWGGDPVRDVYEQALFREFLAQKKPVLGVCRGAQLINVAMGGTLYQDITEQVPGSHVHRDWSIYDKNFHQILIEKGSRLSRLFPGVTSAKVNTVHHQGIKDLGRGLAVEARSEGDGIIEAVRGTGETYVYAIQWHPEFQYADDQKHLDGSLILKDFLDEVRTLKGE